MEGLRIFCKLFRSRKITPGASNCRHYTAIPDLDVSQVWILWEPDYNVEGGGGGGGGGGVGGDGGDEGCRLGV